MSTATTIARRKPSARMAILSNTSLIAAEEPFAPLSADAAINLMAQHRETLRKNTADADRALSAVAEAVHTQAKLLPTEITTDIVKRARNEGLIGGRPEVQNVVAALLAYATRGLDTLRSARSRLRTIIGFAITEAATIPELTKKHGGFWAIYDAARGAEEKLPAAGRRIVLVIPLEVEERAHAQRSVIQLVPAAGRFDYREIMLIAGVTEITPENDVRQLRLPAPAIENAGAHKEEVQAIDTPSEAADDPADDAVPAVKGTGAGQTESEAPGNTPPLALPDEQIDLFTSVPTETPDRPSNQENATTEAVPDKDAGAGGSTAANDAVAAMAAQFLGRKFIIGPLTKYPERFTELKRCAKGERQRLQGAERERFVWAAHTWTPFLAEILQQHDARLVRGDELGATG